MKINLLKRIKCGFKNNWNNFIWEFIKSTGIAFANIAEDMEEMQGRTGPDAPRGIYQCLLLTEDESTFILDPEGNLTALANETEFIFQKFEEMS